MFFNDIPGQREAANHLQHAVQEGRVANTQLLLGAPGAGTLALALAYARYLLCEDRRREDACGQCNACSMIDKLAHPDLHFSFPIHLKEKAKVSDHYVQEWRNAVLKDPFLNTQDWYATLGNANKQGIIGKDESQSIAKKLSLRSFNGGYKVLLIWMPETMNSTAANKLLKAFEEPTPGTVVLMVAQSVENILPTVLSRAQLFKVTKMTTIDVAKALTTLVDLPEEQCKEIALRCGNDLNEAKKEALGHHGQVLDRFREWMRICFKKDVLAAIDFVESVHRSGKEAQKSLLKYGLHMARQCVVQEQVGPELMLSTGEEHDFVERFAPFLNSSKVPVVLEEFDKAYGHLERNANARILFMDLTFTLFKNIGK